MRLFIWFIIVLFPLRITESVEPQARFSGLTIYLDSNPILGNQGNSELHLPNVGSEFIIEIYVPEAAGARTLGYNLEFGLYDLNTVYPHLKILSGTAFDGSALNVDGEVGRATALLLSQPIVPESGYLGRIIWRVNQELESTDTLYLVSATMGDATNQDNDLLNTNSATLDITSIEYIPAMAGDLDLDGDVDFADFLIFARNFGQTGPVPTGPFRDQESEPTVIYETVWVEIDDPNYQAAREMAGFWHFGAVEEPGTDTEPGEEHLGFVFGGRFVEEYTPDEEDLSLVGIAHDGSVAGITYFFEEQSYLILFRLNEDAAEPPQYAGVIVFTLNEDNNPEGYFALGDTTTGEIIPTDFLISNNSAQGWSAQTRFTDHLDLSVYMNQQAIPSRHFQEAVRRLNWGAR